MAGGAGGLAAAGTFVLKKPPSDAQATRRYISAYAAQARASAAASELAIGRRKIGVVLAQVANKCPKILADAPRDTSQANQVEVEFNGALDVAVAQEGSPIVARFARSIHDLRWTNTRLTRRVAAFAQILGLWAAAVPPVPKLCDDLGRWAASGFRVLPLAITDFDRVMTSPPLVPVERTEITETFIAQMLRRYESGSDHERFARARQLMGKAATERLRDLNQGSLALRRELGLRM